MWSFGVAERSTLAVALSFGNVEFVRFVSRDVVVVTRTVGVDVMVLDGGTDGAEVTGVGLSLGVVGNTVGKIEFDGMVVVGAGVGGIHIALVTNFKLNRSEKVFCNTTWS